jgi:multidrug efflux pump subunit AcrA (membrane-fusion protein)
LRLVENTQPEVKVGVPVSVATQMQPGSNQEVEIGGDNYRVKVDSILPEVDSATRTRTVVLKLAPTASNKVAPGEIARLAVAQTTATQGYWLPIEALVKGDRGLWSCFAVVATDSQDKQVKLRSVELLTIQGDRVLVRGMLQPGDLIVANGTHRLVPGQLVSDVTQ